MKIGKNLQPVSSALSDSTTEVTLTYVDQTMHSTYTYIVHMRIMKLKGAESTDHCNPTNDMNQKNSDKNLSGNYQMILNTFSTIFYLSF